MERVNRILQHDLFQYHLQENNSAEVDRRFCRHNMIHFLDVARIGWILCLEEELGIPKDVIYAAALLHDLGKHIQYEKGIGHELTGAEIAPAILKDCGFSKEEMQEISEAIRAHRDPESAEDKGLKGILYRADKLSRPCFACDAEADCNWKEGKKNLRIKI